MYLQLYKLINRVMKSYENMWNCVVVSWCSNSKSYIQVKMRHRSY